MNLPLTEHEAKKIKEALCIWNQGDVSLNVPVEFFHLADLRHPHSPTLITAAEIFANDDEVPTDLTVISDKIPGIVMLTQTCDVIREY